MKKQAKGKCSQCLTGKKTYELDSKEPMCPYAAAYESKKRRCPFYTPLKNPKKLYKITIRKVAHEIAPETSKFDGLGNEENV